MLCDMPYKITNSIIFNITLYFMTNLRREPGPFFFFLLISFSTMVMVMSMIFRTIASASRTLFQALVPAAILIFELVIFTGFVLPKQYMLGWCRWLRTLTSGYAFEALMVNEFHDREFKCTEYVPTSKAPSAGAAALKYANVGPKTRFVLRLALLLEIQTSTETRHQL